MWQEAPGGFPLPPHITACAASESRVWSGHEGAPGGGGAPRILHSAHWALIFVRFAQLGWGQLGTTGGQGRRVNVTWHPAWETLVPGTWDPEAAAARTYSGRVAGAAVAARTAPRLPTLRPPSIPVPPPSQPAQAAQPTQASAFREAYTAVTASSPALQV